MVVGKSIGINVSRCENFPIRIMLTGLGADIHGGRSILS